MQEGNTQAVGKASQEEYRDTSLECMVVSEKLRPKDVKNDKKDFYRYIT